MNDFIYLFAATGTIAVLMVIFSLRSDGKAWWYRGWMVVLFALFLPIAFLGYETLPGIPRHVDRLNLIRYHGEAEILSYQLVRGEGIFLIIAVNGAEHPGIYFRLSWRDKLSDQIQKAAMQADKNNAPLMVNMDKLLQGEIDTDKGTADDAAGNGNPGTPGKSLNLPGADQGWDDRDPVFHPAPPLPQPPKQVPTNRNGRTENQAGIRIETSPLPGEENREPHN